MKYNIILGSKSPRRREILTMAGIDFETIDIDYEEVIPKDGRAVGEIPVYLAEQKAFHATGLNPDQLLITADTLVFLEDRILGKPKNLEEAYEMLQSLSGRRHEVITGVCLRYNDKYESFSDVSKVYFKDLEAGEIKHYIQNHEVLDKAGAYGVQDWMGLIGIERIEGSYFNVMGLPMHLVYQALQKIENQTK